MNLWLRHPIRMMWLRQGYCPLCESSPPLLACSLCHGSYNYGPKFTTVEKIEWTIQFRSWATIYSVLGWRSRGLGRLFGKHSRNAELIGRCWCQK